MTSGVSATVEGRALVDGCEAHEGVVSGELLYSDVGLSFWGGVDPRTGEVIDRSHPLSGIYLAGKVLAIPGSRGSCTGSQVLLELLLNGCAPAAILLKRPDEIIAVGTVVAEELFDCSLPVLSLGEDGFRALAGKGSAQIQGVKARSVGGVDTQALQPATGDSHTVTVQQVGPDVAAVPALNNEDQVMLDGSHGRAVQAAMRVLVRAAAAQGAASFIDVSQVHIDGCTYGSPGQDHPAGLRFAQKLVELGGRVRVPTTLNSMSVDQTRWRELGIPADFGEPASALGDAYVALGATPSFTCAPYLLESAPSRGEQIGWGESNAVVFANSVLGARTQKYADFLDICIAITGRAPDAGCHLDQNRKAKVVLRLPAHLNSIDDAFYPTLGYLCGLKAEARVPAILGLEAAAPTRDDLKAFSAAFGTAASVPLFHIVGVTPEAPGLASVLDEAAQPETIDLTHEDLAAAFHSLDSSQETDIDLISLGNPHLSLEEYSKLAEMCHGRRRHDRVRMVITTGREVLAKARTAGYAGALEAFGAEIVSDTCWCMLGEPVVPSSAKTLMTNSAKYAHYAPGLVNRQVRFGTMASCVSAAETSVAPRHTESLPGWLIPGRGAIGSCRGVASPTRMALGPASRPISCQRWRIAKIAVRIAKIL